MSELIEQVSLSERFDSFLRTSDRVLVDFWASWCGPCRAQLPILARLAKEWEGTIKILKVNVEELPDLAAKYGVQSIPTLVYFENGEEEQRFVGLQTEDTLAEQLTPQGAKQA